MESGNIAKWLREHEVGTGELIESIVIGRHDSHSYDKTPFIAAENTILSREAGLTILDVDYDDGFGGAECFPMFAWTATRVYFMSEYDGATQLSWVPRNPIPCAPGFDGMNGSDDGC